MKVTALLSLLAILMVLAICLLVGLPFKGANVPGFSKIPTPFSASVITYDFLGRRPFEGGKMWIATGPDSVIYDIEGQRELGQVTNAWPVMLLGNSQQLLCCQPTGVGATNRLRDRLLSFVTMLSGGRIKFPARTPSQTYWLLDLANGTPKRLGDIPGNPNLFFPSPDFRYSFTVRTDRSAPEVYLLDLLHPSMQILVAPGWAYDWWDNTQILVQTTNNDFVLLDVHKGATAPLIAAEKLTAFLQENGIEHDPRQTHPFAIWNGRDNDFYLTDTHQKWLAQPSFLIKVERPGGRLKLLSPHFKFEWSDHLDATGRYYLSSGRESGLGSDAVFLRLLGTGMEKVLVASGTNKSFSLPRFYRDSVIYVRSNALWEISLDGSKNVRLFPTAEAQDAGQP